MLLWVCWNFRDHIRSEAHHQSQIIFFLISVKILYLSQFDANTPSTFSRNSYSYTHADSLYQLANIITCLTFLLTTKLIALRKRFKARAENDLNKTNTKVLLSDTEASRFSYSWYFRSTFNRWKMTFIATMEATKKTIPDNTDPDNDVWLSPLSLGFFINAKLMGLNIILSIPVVLADGTLDESNIGVIERHRITFLFITPPLAATM